MACTLVLALLASSRIVITEVMANPAGPDGAHYPEDRNEFVELCNLSSDTVDLDSWILDDLDGSLDRLAVWQDSSILAANPFIIIGSTLLRPGGYAVVLDAEYTDSAPSGGHEQPYRFGDSCLILTTHNTTLGNGLATTDPLIISSAAGDTATFGTPCDTTDGFPSNPGDGFSWERLNPFEPDTAPNWAVCPDSAGCTPGRPNKAGSVPDLAVFNLELVEPENLRPGENFACRVTVANVGLVSTQDWSLDLFLDRNGNGVPDKNEDCAHTQGWLIASGEDSLIEAGFSCPQVATELWARLNCLEDADTSNNRSRLTVNVAGSGRLLSLVVSSFSPNQDGIEDSLQVVYRLPRSGGKLQVAVFDLAGRTIRTLFDGTAKLEHDIISWDGKLTSGRAAAGGVYAVWLQYHLPDFDRVEKLPVVLKRGRPTQ